MAASLSEGTWQHLIPAAAEGQWHTRTFALDALLSFAYNSEDADSTKVLMWNNNELRACCFSALAEGRPADVREAAFSLLRSLAFADENKAQMWANEECQAIWCIAGGLSCESSALGACGATLFCERRRATCLRMGDVSVVLLCGCRCERGR